MKKIILLLATLFLISCGSSETITPKSNVVPTPEMDTTGLVPYELNDIDYNVYYPEGWFTSKKSEGSLEENYHGENYSHGLIGYVESRPNFIDRGMDAEVEDQAILFKLVDFEHEFAEENMDLEEMIQEIAAEITYSDDAEYLPVTVGIDELPGYQVIGQEPDENMSILFTLFDTNSGYELAIGFSHVDSFEEFTETYNKVLDTISLPPIPDTKILSADDLSALGNDSLKTEGDDRAFQSQYPSNVYAIQEDPSSLMLSTQEALFDNDIAQFEGDEIALLILTEEEEPDLIAQENFQIEPFLDMYLQEWLSEGEFAKDVKVATPIKVNGHQGIQYAIKTVVNEYNQFDTEYPGFVTATLMDNLVVITLGITAEGNQESLEQIHDAVLSSVEINPAYEGYYSRSNEMIATPTVIVTE